MIEFIQSNNIQIFPSTFRTVVPNGKFTSEKNFTNILKSITDKTDYIIETPESTSTSGTVKFVLGGYYFELLNFKATDVDNNVWVQIKIENDSHSIVSYVDQSTTLDSGSEFKALHFANTKDEEVVQGYTKYNLQLTKVSSGVSVWCTHNKVKLSTDSIEYSVTKNLTEEINAKQYTLTPVAPIEISNTYDIKLNQLEVNKLTSLSGNDIAHSANGDLIYFDNDGLAKKQGTYSVGGLESPTGANYRVNKSTKVENGKIVEGPAFYISTETPLNTQGVSGDFWFKYNSNS